MSERLYLYPRWIRIWHIINAILCLILILTGVSMYFAGTTGSLISFKTSVLLHNHFGIVLTANYLFFIIGNWISPNGKHYRLRRKKFFKNLMIQSMYYAVGIFKKEKKPFPITEDNKFNPLQKLSYVVIVYFCLTIIVLSGWGFLFPEFIPDNIFGVNGLLINDVIHIIMGFMVTVFLFIHIYISTIGISIKSNFVSIITGWHEH